MKVPLDLFIKALTTDYTKNVWGVIYEDAGKYYTGIREDVDCTAALKESCDRLNELLEKQE